MPPASSARTIISTGASRPPASARSARRSSLVVTSPSSRRDESTIQKDPFREFDEDEQTKRERWCQEAARNCCPEVTSEVTSYGAAHVTARVRACSPRA